MIDSIAYFKAKQELNKFLEENPRAKEMQAKIEEAIEKCGDNSQNRISTLYTMMAMNVASLQEKLLEVKTQAERIMELAGKKD